MQIRIGVICLELYNGDCLEVMKSITDKSIDLILCDLPYGSTHNKWDKCIDFERLWECYNRIIKDNGAIVLFSQQPFTTKLIMSNLKMFRYEWIWEKSQGTGFLNAHKMPLKIHENICVFYKRLPKFNPQMRTGFKKYVRTASNKSSDNYNLEQDSHTTTSNGERYPIDIIQFASSNCSTTDKHCHPTQKPRLLLEYFIKTYTDEGDTVLDNAMGVGSTGVACAVTNRNFIGIELDKNYYNVAKNRIGGVKSDIQKM